MVILGGTNNSLNGNFDEIYNNLEENLVNLSKRNPVFITTILERCDINGDDAVVTKINTTNSYIKELEARLDNVKLIYLDRLERSCFTRHGLHFSMKGKTKLAGLIIYTVTHYTQNIQERARPIRVIKGNMNSLVQTAQLRFHTVSQRTLKIRNI